MPRFILIIFYIVIFGSFSIFIQPIAAFEFETESGLLETGSETGHYATLFGLYTLPQIIGKIISGILAFLGIIFLGFMIYGGYIWMIAKGNEQEVEKAKNIIKNASIGLIIVMIAYGITYTLTNIIRFGEE